MNKKWAPYIFIVLMIVAIVIIKLVKGNDKPTPKPKTTTTNPKDPASSPNRDRGFDRRISYLKYSNHATCRMKCRKISKLEVEEIMRDGNINYAKSDVNNDRCPRYAVEGRTKDDQRVRIVYAQCNESTTVVTVIDLETNFECHCPGDDDKYKNQR